jgi:hypothetical protein
MLIASFAFVAGVSLRTIIDLLIRQIRRRRVLSRLKAFGALSFPI